LYLPVVSSNDFRPSSFIFKKSTAKNVGPAIAHPSLEHVAQKCAAVLRSELRESKEIGHLRVSKKTEISDRQALMPP
jgi:hypothetical protein